MTENIQQFEYMLLNRLQSDCYSYLENGCSLWGVTPQSHMNKMIELFNTLNVKPEWLTLKELKELHYKLLKKEFNNVLYSRKDKENNEIELTINHYNTGETYYSCKWYKQAYKITNGKSFKTYEQALNYCKNLNIGVY